MGTKISMEIETDILIGTQKEFGMRIEMVIGYRIAIYNLLTKIVCF